MKTATASSSRRWKSETDDTENTTMAEDRMALLEMLRKRSMVASAIRAVFEQPDEASARDECSRVIATLEPRMPAGAPAARRCRA